MAEKNSLWRNIRKKAEQNRRTGAKPKKPTAEMLRQERKIKANQKADGGPVGNDGLYNMQRALELGYTPDETGHWPSVDSETGMWLKSKEHPTAWMEYMYGYALNPEVQKQYQHPVVNPEGYFGENQLQYNLKAKGGQYLTVDGQAHRVYRNADDDIIVNHPKEDLGKWDTINLTDKSGANTIPEGVTAVRKWHGENPSYATGGKLYAEGGSEDEPKLLNRDGLLIAPALPEFEISENLTDEEKFRIEKYNERLNQQKAFQEKWYPGQEYDPTNIERRASIYADDATAKYILNNHASRNDYKNRQTYLQSFTPWQKEVIARSNYSGNFKPDIGTQFRMGFNKLIGRDYLGAQRMNYDEDISREDYEKASKLGIFSPLMYPINAVKGIVKDEGKLALSGEIASSPWVDATDMALGNEEDVWKYNLEGDIALDPLNFGGVGIGSSSIDDLSKVGKYLTTQTPLKNTYKINPFAFKPNPEAYYHRSPNLDNIVNQETGMLQGFGQSAAGRALTEKNLSQISGINLKKGANSQLYFAKGVPLDFGRYNTFEVVGKTAGQGYPGPYMVEVKGVPMGVSTKGSAPGVEPTQIGSYAVSKRPISLDEAKFYKEDWLRGYKPIEGGPMYYARGGFMEGLEDVGKLLVNTVASPIEQISGNNFVNWNYNNKWASDAAAVSEGIIGAATDVAGSVLLPGVYGQAKGAIQGFTKNLGHSTEYQRGANKWANTTGQIASSAGDLTAGIMSGDVKQIVGGSGKLLGTIGSETGSKELSMLGQAAGIGSMFINPSQAAGSSMPTGLPMDSGIPSFNPTTDIVNQGLSFAANGGPINNNLLTLQTGSMRENIKNHRKKYSKGGTFHKYGINPIPDSAGYHHKNAYGGVTIGRDAMAEGGEFVIDGNYVISDEVDGMNTLTKDGKTMAEIFDRYLSPYKLRDLNSKNKDGLRRPNDSISQHSIEQKKEQIIAEHKELKAKEEGKAQQKEMMVEGALQYAAAGGKLNKDLEKILSDDIQSYVEADNYYAYGGYLPKDKRFNMPNSYAKGGSIHIKKSKRGTFTAAAKKRGKSVQEFARQVLANKGNYSSAMVKKANFARNAAKWHHAEGGNIRPDNPGFNALPEYVQDKIVNNMAHGGPVVSNVNQDFDLYAQNRGGMMMAEGGNMYAVGGPPYDLPGMADMTASEYNDIINYLNNLNTPNYVDNQGNTSSILGRRNKNKSTPVQPIERMQSRNLQQLPTDNTPLSINTNNYPESSYRPATLTEEEQNMLDKMSNTAGFIPSDVMSGKLGTSTAPFPYEEGPVDNSIPKVGPSIEQNIRFVPPGGSDIIEDLPGTVPTQTKVSDEAIGQSYLGTAANPNLPKLTFTQSDATKYGLNPNDVNITDDTKVNQPNQGLTGLDYGMMVMGSLGAFDKLRRGAKGPDPVNFERIGFEPYNYYPDIVLADAALREGEDKAAYDLKQYAPSSGSYMANRRALGLGAGKNRADQRQRIKSAATQFDLARKTGIDAQNAQIQMQESIARQQELDAARENVTEGLDMLGNRANMVYRDYKINKVNETIANNIGTTNWKVVDDGKGGSVVVFRGNDGSYKAIPYQQATTPNTNSTTASTGYMTPVNPNTTTPVATAAKSFKFDDNITDKTKGDAFRAWVNKNYPRYAKNADLSLSGVYNNDYIKDAWDVYGEKYLGQS